MNEISRIVRAVLVLLVSLFLVCFVVGFVAPAVAETPVLPDMPGMLETPEVPEPPETGLEFPGWRVDGVGTYFEVGNSSYLNVTLASSEVVHVVLESVPRMISFVIESNGSAVSTTLTFGGFEAGETYYRYEDGCLMESFVADLGGGYSYVQDLSRPHHVFIVESLTTITIMADGSIDPPTANITSVDNVTYTFTADINEPVVVKRSNIIVDGKGYTLQGSGSGNGFYLSGINNVTIQNMNIKNFSYGVRLTLSSSNTISENNITENTCGIYLYQSSSNTISGNNITENNYYGILLYQSSSNTISGNTVLSNTWPGICLSESSGNTVNGNTISNNNNGIYLYWSSDNTISGNTASNNNLEGIYLYYSSGNTVNGNTISNNNGSGIYLSRSNGKTISGNTISNNNDNGIYLYYSSGNTVNGNIVSNNNLGIYLLSSDDNLIYHNNIIENVLYQAYELNSAYNDWHHPDLLEGNYWSDYEGEDIGGQTYAWDPTRKHLIAGDGIGDTLVPHPYEYYDYYPFIHENGWLQHYLTLNTSPPEITTPTGEDFYLKGTLATISTPTFVYPEPGVRYRFTNWTTTDITEIADPTSNTTTVLMDKDKTVTANYIKQYYLTVVSPYDTPGGEGWYDEGETAHAILAIGLEYIDSLAYGFVGWSGNATGWELISDPIIMDAPKTAIANWEPTEVYGDVRTIGFWKHQVNVWYFTELKNNGMKIRGIGTAQISQDDLMAYLKFISDNSGYAAFQGIWVEGDKLATLENAYDILKTPRGPDSMKMRAEQQLLALWLNLAHKAFFWNTELSQDTLYIYRQYSFDEFDGLATVGEAILFCEAELLKSDDNYEAVKSICDSINNNLGIIWET